MVQFFPNPDDMEIIPLLLMMIFYGYILLNASKLMSDGCELLLLLFGPGIIGGLVIPTLGAVPDSVMILMSGIKSGTPEEIQDQITVGVGTLVGSTVMLITIPWGVSIFLGRRDLDPATGMALENNATGKKKSPVYTSFSWRTTCISTLSDIPTTSIIMLVATVNYLVVQLPVFAVGSERGRDGVLTAFILSAVGFVVYCVYQYLSNAAEERERAKQEQLRFHEWKHTLHAKQIHGDGIAKVFHEFDTDHSGFLALSEFSSALESLGLKVSRRDATEIFKAIDVGAEGSGGVAGDGKLHLAEFRAAVKLWVSTGQSVEEVKKAQHVANLISQKSVQQIRVIQNSAEENKTDNTAELAAPQSAALQTSSSPSVPATTIVDAVTSPLQSLRRRLNSAAPPAADLSEYSLAKTLVKQSILRSTRQLHEGKEQTNVAVSGRTDSSGNVLAKKGSSKKKGELLLVAENKEDEEPKSQAEQNTEAIKQNTEKAAERSSEPDTDAETDKENNGAEQHKKHEQDVKKTEPHSAHKKRGSQSDKDYGTFVASGALEKSNKTANEEKAEQQEDEEEEEDEEDDDEHWELSEHQLKYKALALLCVGTILLVIFSDPMVDVLSALGNTLHISPFYVSFVITPLASNASEVMASVIFARKKTNASISLTLSALHGAATMNATIALAVFTALVYFRNLNWSFSAEVLAVVLVTVIVAVNALRRTIFMWQAVIVASLYPLCILFVAILENVFGVD